MRYVCVLVLAAACGGGPGAATPDASPDGDAPPSSGGLIVSWSATPTLPGTITGEITVTSAVFKIDHLQVIGDAGPGDSHTTKSNYVLTWNADTAPMPIVFADAAPGLYSKVTLDVQTGLFQDSYDIKGTVKIEGETKTFHIHDSDALTIPIACNQTLPPAGSATIAIELALTPALTGIDYNSLDTDGGSLDLDTNDDQMAAFRGKLIQSFAPAAGSQPTN